MTGTANGSRPTADDLRRAFDASFAATPAARREEVDPFLALTIGGNAYAIRVSEISGVAAARKIVPIASPIAEMIGLAGIRGDLVPVYSLAALLGYANDGARVGWFVLCKSAFPIALAFTNLDGYVEIARSGRHPTDAGSGEPHPARPHVQEVLRDANGVREVIGIAPLLEAIAKRVASVGIVKEP